MMELLYYPDKELDEFILLYKGEKSEFNLCSIQTLERQPFITEVNGEMKKLKVFEYGWNIPAGNNTQVFTFKATELE